MLLHEIYRGEEEEPEFDGKTTIELWHPRDETGATQVEVPLELDVDITPTEYEGDNVFNQGSVDITGVTIDKPFRFLGRQFKAGTPFPDELLPYVQGGEIFQGKEPSQQAFIQYLSDQLDIDIPSERYRDSRSY